MKSPLRSSMPRVGVLPMLRQLARDSTHTKTGPKARGQGEPPSLPSSLRPSAEDSAATAALKFPWKVDRQREVAMKITSIAGLDKNGCIIFFQGNTKSALNSANISTRKVT